MADFYARREYVMDGLTNEVSIPFPYLQKPHIKVYFDDVLQDSGTYTYLSNSTIDLGFDPASGVVVRVQRITPIDDLLQTLQGGGTLNSAQLNLAFTQTLYALQEAKDDGGAASELLGILLTLLNNARYNDYIEIQLNPPFYANEAIYTHVTSLAVRLPADDGVTGERYVVVAGINTAVGADQIWAIKQNGSTVGTITVEEDTDDVTIDIPADVDFLSDDVMSVVVQQDGNIHQGCILFRTFRAG